MFCLRSGLKSEWIDTDLPNNTVRWRRSGFILLISYQHSRDVPATTS
jgi:hypothetical protein